MSTYMQREKGLYSRIDEADGATLRYEEFDVPEVSEADQRRAMLYVCEKSEDADDARLLLEALGLHGTAPSKPSGKGECPECGELMTARYVKKHLELKRCKGAA